ncbi:MAG: glutathione S-transferase family protein [Betaproteobacteria bacterium]|nr:glutathione S-transferase family protein [Betaproteobacteria bacterium]
MIQLHYFPGNASFIPHLLLEELGVPFALCYVDRAKSAHKAPAYLKLNPNGQIPVFVEGDLVLYETAAICVYLLDQYPQAGLAPAYGSAERAHFNKWLMWFTNSVQATLMLYVYPERWVDEGNSVGAAQLKAHSEAKVGGMLDQIDAQLAARRDRYFFGERFGALDAWAFLMGRWTRFFGRPARSLPHYGPYLGRMLARPAVQRVIANEKLAAPLV